jgi:hypothetical protein
MIEEHVLQEPEWIKQTLDVIVDSMLPLGFIGPLGYRWWEPGNLNNSAQGWQLAVYPTANRVLGGGPHDGQTFVSGFKLNVSKILAVFDKISVVEWAMPTRYNGDLDGPEFNVRGVIDDEHVWLRIFSLPPLDESASYLVNYATGEAQPI